MKIQCQCGKVQAQLTGFPRHTPGRLVCYCNDCQNFLEKINRTDLLDEYGGTEVIPVYPSEIEILKGKEFLRCNRLTPEGLNRWTADCCNSPIANTKSNFPWAGLMHSVFTVEDPNFLQNFGPIRARIMGQYAKNNPAFKISDKISLLDMLKVFPFILKGKILKKHKHSPFFEDDGTTPVSPPKLL
ncbi:DUF6151 family protein [Sneathiella aquimaris]|uniref:DUF6151 family protein n=1 Tax=Sneathiella aquimaris TaxID=2599305 RepID=UPI00146B16B5|nr:DUF6151 family protein [Sneathiella aquimaris]